MKNQIIKKLFLSKWNYAWGKVDSHLISLFYKKGGFSGLYDFIVSEKERLNRAKPQFHLYYSEDLIEILQQAKDELEDIDFRDYIFNPLDNIVFNRNNFIQLEKHDMLQYYYDFSDNFRGNIVAMHKIGNYCIIETTGKEGNTLFYNKGNSTICFSELEQALLYAIYGGRHFDSLLILLYEKPPHK